MRNDCQNGNPTHQLTITSPGRTKMMAESVPAADATPPAESAGLPLPICPVVPQLPEGDDAETQDAEELDSDGTGNGGDA